MAERQKPYRRRPSEAFERVRDEAQESRFFVLQSLGPTGFVLRDEADKKFRACIGSRHTCTCGQCSEEHCVHTAFVLLRILRVPPENPLCWQSSLTDAEIAEAVAAKQREEDRKRIEAQRAERRAAAQARLDSQRKKPSEDKNGEDEGGSELVVTSEDTCPICYEDILPDDCKEGSREYKTALRTVTFCKTGCQKCIHAQCMKVWADHRLSIGEEISCPLCRAQWPAEAMLQLRRGAGVANRRKAIFWGHSCKRCRMMPLRGVLHTCLLCDPLVELCETCFLHPSDPAHTKHPFVKRATPETHWVPALRTVHDTQVQLSRLRREHERQQRAALQEALSLRELGPEDYELLQQLGRTVDIAPATASVETEESLQEYLIRIVAEHEPTKAEWMKARAASSGPAALKVCNGHAKPRSALELCQGDERSDACAFGSCCKHTGVDHHRTVKLRCGHAAHQDCIAQNLQIDAVEPAQAGSHIPWSCPRCATPVLPGWAAAGRNQSPRSSASQGASTPEQTAARASLSSAPGLSIVGGGLIPPSAPQESSEVSRPSNRKESSHNPCATQHRRSHVSQHAKRSASLGSQQAVGLVVGNGPETLALSDDTIVRRARMQPLRLPRNRSASPKASISISQVGNGAADFPGIVPSLAPAPSQGGSFGRPPLVPKRRPQGASAAS